MALGDDRESQEKQDEAHFSPVDPRKQHTYKRTQRGASFPPVACPWQRSRLSNTISVHKRKQRATEREKTFSPSNLVVVALSLRLGLANGAPAERGAKVERCKIVQQADYYSSPLPYLSVVLGKQVGRDKKSEKERKRWSCVLFTGQDVLVGGFAWLLLNWN